MIGIFLILTVIALATYFTTRRPKNFPPGPPVFPIIGNLLQVDITNVNVSLRKLNEKYGDCGIIIYPYKLIVLKNKDLIKQMFANEFLCQRPDVVFNRDRFDGNNLGIICIGGDLLTVNKRFALHTFKNLGMGTQRQERIIQEEAFDLVDQVEKTKSQPFEIEPLLAMSNLNITWTILGGERFDKTDPNFLSFASAVHNVVHHISIFGNISVIMPILRHLFPKLTKHEYLMRDNAIVLELIKKTIAHHKASLNTEAPRDFIDLYLIEIEKQTELSSKYMTEKQLEAMVYDSIVAGSDTTSTLVSVTILYLSIHQDVQQKLYEEINTHIGQMHSPSGQDVLNLSYCKAVLSEAMRLRPPVPVVMPHEASQDTSIGDYNVPKGTLVFAHMEEAFLDEKTWGDPQNFRPERFITEEGSYQTPDTFLPFGKGKRKCLGEAQAKLTATLLLSHLLQKFKFQLPKGIENLNTHGTKDFVMKPPRFEVVAIPREL